MYTTAVTDTTAFLTVPCEKAVSVSVGGMSDTPSAQLDFEVIFVDGAGNIVGVTAPSTLICASAKDWPLITPATLYRGHPQIDGGPSFHASGVTAFVDVMALRPATAKWTLSAAVLMPVGVTILT